MSQHQIGEIAALATAVLWTLSALAWTSAGREVGALAVSFLRLVLAVPILMLYCRIARGHAWPSEAGLGAWEMLGASGFLGFFISDLCQFKSFLIVGPRLSLLIVSSLTPPVTVFFSWLYRGEGFGLRSWIGMGITLAGVLWVLLERRAGEEQPHTREQLRRGICLSLVATVVQSFGMVLATQGESLYPNQPADCALIRILGALVGYVILVSLWGRWPAMAKASHRGRAMLIMAGGTIVGPCAGVTTLMIGLDGCGEGIVTTILATIPVMILPFSIYFYGERVSLRALAGALVAVVGVAVLMWPANTEPQPAGRDAYPAVSQQSAAAVLQRR